MDMLWRNDVTDDFFCGYADANRGQIGLHDKQATGGLRTARGTVANDLFEPNWDNRSCQNHAALIQAVTYTPDGAMLLGPY